MKLKIAAAAILIFLVGCKTKEVRVENTFKTDSTNHVEIKKEIEILTLQTDTGLIVEEQTIDYQITTDSAGTKSSIPIKMVKKKWHKYNHQIKAAERKQIKSEQKVNIKKEIKAESVEKSSFQFKWFVILFIISLLILFMIFLYLK